MSVYYAIHVHLFVIFSMLFLASVEYSTMALYICSSKSSILFGLITMPSDMARQKNCVEHWLKKAQENGHEGIFISAIGKEIPGYRYLHPTEDQVALTAGTSLFLKSNKDRGMKRMIGMEYFLYQTNFEYYWSLTEDVSIDVDWIETLIDELNLKYNPINDNVFIGQSHGNFLQGGTGVIISRHAAEVLLPYMKGWVKNMGREDDVSLDQLRVILGLQVSETYAPYMFGEEPFAFQDANFWRHEFGTCVKTSIPTSPVYPLCDLVALHARMIDQYAALSNLVNAKKFISDLYFSYMKTNMHLCRWKSYHSCDHLRKNINNTKWIF